MKRVAQALVGIFALSLGLGCGSKSSSSSSSNPPPAPAAVAALALEGGVILVWSPVPGAKHYTINRGEGAGSTMTFLNITPVTTYTDTAVTTGVTYYYEVAAADAAGTGTYASAVSATVTSVTTATLPPLAPTNLAAAGGSGVVTLNWTGSLGATSYVVFRSTTSGGPYTELATVMGSGDAYNDLYLTNGTQYCYVVEAANSVGSSGYSSQACATPSASGGGGGGWWQ